MGSRRLVQVGVYLLGCLGSIGYRPYGSCGEPNSNSQSSAGEGVCLEIAVVSGYNRGDDGQPQPDALPVGDPLVEAGERFEQR
jgi:hypothetical protein